jgi:hypothetical protein
MKSTRYSSKILMKLEFSPQIFEEYSLVKFHEIPFGWNRIVPCGRVDVQTDRHYEANSRFPQICKRA